MLRYLIILLLFSVGILRSQELNCIVNINHAEIGISNKKIFDTMQNDIFEYMNNTKWTNATYQNYERIDCSMTINILEVEGGNSFKGTL